jgi:hypothetical protein
MDELFSAIQKNAAGSGLDGDQLRRRSTMEKGRAQSMKRKNTLASSLGGASMKGKGNFDYLINNDS